MFKKIINFIKYHNAVSIVFSVILLSFSLSLAVSSDLREGFVSSEDIILSVDNNYILKADLDNFNFDLKITDITSDNDNYYIDYIFNTIDIENYVWQSIEKEKALVVSKRSLGGGDLGLYVAEKLGNVINREHSYLKKVQQIEKGIGLTQKISTTKYTGLIGKYLEPKEKVFPGYEPVVIKESITKAGNDKKDISIDGYEKKAAQEISSKETFSREEIRRIVEEILNEQEYLQHLAKTDESSLTEPSTTTPSTADPDYMDGESEQIECVSDWQCDDWQPKIDEEYFCGQVVEQSRVCIDLKECKTNKERPLENREVNVSECLDDDSQPTSDPDYDNSNQEDNNENKDKEE